MVKQALTVVALPHSKSPDAEFHVSLFVAPRLTPDGAEGALSEFPIFLKWADLLRAGEATIELFDATGPLDAEPLLQAVDPDAYGAAFPADTPVRVPETPDLGDRHWRTFPVAELHDGSKLFHAAAVFLSPVAPLSPVDHPFTEYIEGMGRGPRQQGYDERVITQRFDETIGESARRPLSLPAIEKRLSSMEDPVQRFMAQLHRARRFYERPEAQVPYQERPDEGAVKAPPPRPDPDFHERCAFVGDHPTLLRRFGLVIDLRVADLARLAKAKWLTGRITLPGGLVSTDTRTTCKAVGDDLVTGAATSDWLDGALRIGDPGRFAVLDVDPDGTILKAERYLLSLPRLHAAERNGDPVHASPTALRTGGFTVVRKGQAQAVLGRLDRQGIIAAELAGAPIPLLTTEDVTQGYRVEVWDDTTQRWYSLHHRRIEAVALAGDGSVAVAKGAEVGFIEGTTVSETVDVDDSPVHAHEAMFGWEGWSLSAPKPGKRIRHQDGDEVVEDQDADPDPVTPLVVRTEVEPGTLPRLRYGRSYAFRVWAADLAGNSRPHQVGPVPPPDDDAVATATALASRPAARHAATYVEPLLRSGAASVIVRRRHPEEGATEAGLPDALVDAGISERILHDVAARRSGRLGTEGRAVTVDRGSLVSEAFAATVLDEAQPLLVDTAVIDAAALAGPLQQGLAPEAVSPLRPFLRWDPVPPPAIVSRHGYTEGESLRQVVIRSGVTQDPATLEITVTPPEDYAAATADHGYHGTSERHLVPPKTSQGDAELHGAFDEAIGSLDPADHKKLLAVALREAGTLFDVDVPNLSDPLTRDPQPGIALLADPGVPDDAKKTLPLPPGEMPAPGQYVVHDTDQLLLPYLPDVLGRGISLVFPEAGRDRQIAFPFGTEGFTAAYAGTWPERLPFRLVLAGAAELHGALDKTVLTIGLPPGDIQRFRLASSLDDADLDLFGLWRALPQVLRDNPDVREAVKDGWLWAFTPFEEVTLVHAVPRPLEAPRPTVLTVIRAPGQTDVPFAGTVDVHGPSTESLTVEARWVDPVDDLTLAGPEDRPQKGIAFTTPIHPEEDIALLYGGATDVAVDLPTVGPVWAHSAIHKLGDTRHHTISYRFRATTRFREYFAPELLAEAGPADPSDEDTWIDDGKSVVGPETVINVPSTAVPAAPRVHSVIPLFRWDQGTEPEQPVAVRRRRRTGVRIYLERPWYSSGEGELLGVLLAPNPLNDGALHGRVVSGWGGDPVWKGRDVPLRGQLVLDNLLRLSGLDDRPGDALPVTRPATLPLTTVRGQPEVTVLGYRPQFSAERDMWYVDVAIDPLDTVWPFVQLAVARYQPDSIPGCHLSAPVLCDFVQLPVERTASVSRTDVRHVRVVVSGPVAVRHVPAGGPPTLPTDIPTLEPLVRTNRVLVARLQRRDTKIPTDLGWITVDAVELELKGHGRTNFEGAWVGALEADRDLPLKRPGANKGWRVTVEEWEMLPGDPADLSGGIVPKPPVWERRLVYADELAL